MIDYFLKLYLEAILDEQFSLDTQAISSKATVIYIPAPKMYIFTPRMYIQAPKMYISTLRMYIPAPKMYISTPRMYIPDLRMYISTP